MILSKIITIAKGVEMAAKKARLNKTGIKGLPNNKPAVYKIKNMKGKNVYTGSAKLGRLQERLADHLREGIDRIPGGYEVDVTQKSSIAEAQNSEENIIKREKPKYNIKGKP